MLYHHMQQPLKVREWLMRQAVDENRWTLWHLVALGRGQMHGNNSGEAAAAGASCRIQPHHTVQDAPEDRGRKRAFDTGFLL